MKVYNSVVDFLLLEMQIDIYNCWKNYLEEIGTV